MGEPAMINQLGTYATRNGRLVEITRILRNQPIAEGYLLNDGKRVFMVWNTDGYVSRIAENANDIVEFLAFYEPEED